MSVIARIGCCDKRCQKDGVYYFGTVGAAVLPALLENMIPVLGNAEEVQLVMHRDCGATRLRLGLPFSGPLTAEEAEMVDLETARFGDENFRKLTAHPALAVALERGVPIRLGFDTLNGTIEWKAALEKGRLIADADTRKAAGNE